MNQSTPNNIGAPANNWASGHQGKKKDSTMWIPAMLVGAMIFAVGCGSGILVGWFAGASSDLSDIFDDFSYEPAEIIVETSMPETIKIGERFELIVMITDTAGKARTLRDVDFSGTLVENANFLTITPSPNTVSPEAEYIEHVFDSPLGANQTFEVTFIIEPKQPGFYSAEISAYVDDYSSEDAHISIEVLGETEESDNLKETEETVPTP
jgi:hypothetical protein